jgi:hypothetical protein
MRVTLEVPCRRLGFVQRQPRDEREFRSSVCGRAWGRSWRVRGAGRTSFAGAAPSGAGGVAGEALPHAGSGPTAAAQGLVRLTLALTGPGQVDRCGDRLPDPRDLSNSTVVIRAYAPEATGGQLHVYLLDQEYSPGASLEVPLSALSDGWSDIEVPVNGMEGDFDPTRVIQVELQIEAGSSGPWSNPTVIYIDSIRASSGGLNDTFDTSLDPMLPSVIPESGLNMTWVDALPEA